MATHPNNRIFDDETHLAVTHLNVTSISDMTTGALDDVSGWYYSPSSFGNIGYFTDRISQVDVQLYANGPYGNKPNGIDRANPTLTFSLYRLSSNNNALGSAYSTIAGSTAGSIYDYDSQLQQFTLNQTRTNNLYFQGLNAITSPVYRKWKAPDSRMWSYFLKTEDPSAIFNSFEVFFRYVYDYYKSGRLSSFTEDPPALPLLNINPYNLDFSEVKRNFNGGTRYQYDAIFSKLTTTGVFHQYNIQKFVYWPTPAIQALLTPAARTAVIGDINIQRGRFLAFYPILAGQEICKLAPSTKVTIRNSGTRFDNQQLRIFFTGFHNTPKPGPEFVNPNFYQLYNYYSLVLPLFIQAGVNDTLYYQRPGELLPSAIVIPAGNWYSSELLNYINRNYPFLFLTFNSTLNTTFPASPPFPQTQFRATQSMTWLVFAAEPGTQIFGPLAFTASTFLGTSGLDLGYKFPVPVLTADGDGIVFTLQSTPQQINTYTPLTVAEIESLVANLAVITVEKQHGPVRNDMPYDEFYACVTEMTVVASTETHTSSSAWAYRVEFADRQLPNTFQDLKDMLSQSVLDYSITYGAGGAGTPPNIYQTRYFTGAGNYGEMSEWYRSGIDKVNDNTELNANLFGIPFIYPGLQNRVPYGRTIVLGGQVYDIGGREVEVAVMNYLADAQWMTTFVNPDGSSAFGFLPYGYYESDYSGNPNRLDGGFITTPSGVLRANSMQIGSSIPILGLTGILALANPLNASGPVTDLTGQIALVARDPAVDESTAVLNCQNAGAIAVVMYNYAAALPAPGVFQIFAINTPPNQIPAMSLSYNDGLIITGEVGNEITLNGSQVIDGQYLVGYLTEARVRTILGLPVGPVPTIGYMTHYSSDFTMVGDPSEQPWYAPDGSPPYRGPNFMAATMMRYWNSNNVQHLFFDILNTQGGITAVLDALVGQMGADRFQHYATDGNLLKLQNFDDTGSSTQYSLASARKLGEDAGAYDYNNVMENILGLPPQSVVAKGIFAPDQVFGGPAPPVGVRPGLNTERVLIWTSTMTTISATQAAYSGAKGASLTQAFDGAYGNNVQMVGYGSYERAFSTGGNYDSYLNWYSKGRESTEELMIPPMSLIDRYELALNELIDFPLMKNPGQDFTRFQQPNILWDMKSDVYFQDIGYTIGTPAEAAYGANWVPLRYPGVDFEDYRTWRHTILERSVQMMTNPALNSNFFVPGSTIGKLTM